MENVITLDGIKTQLVNPDLDKDGNVGGVERITMATALDIQPIVQPTELGESLKELNEDNLSSSTRMSGIDLRSRLHETEVMFILQLDALVAMGVVPSKCLSFTRQKKRLNVSIDGKGRGEIVDIVAGKKEMEARTGFGGFVDRMKSGLGMGNG